MTHPEILTRARELYADSFGHGHVHRERILRGEWDAAPNMQPFIVQAERDVLSNRGEVVEE